MQYSTLQYQDLEQKREIIGMSIRFKECLKIQRN
jgi:hypothetical protein